MPLALENRVWRQHAIYFQELYVSALKVIIYPSVFIHSLIIEHGSCARHYTRYGRYNDE